jgi:hypothetical protein
MGKHKTCLAIFIFKAMQSDVSLHDPTVGVAEKIHLEPYGLLRHLVIGDDGKQGVYWSSP